MTQQQRRQPELWPDDGIILYDGVCVFCSGWVRFVLKRDAARRFRFTPIQSPYGQSLAVALGIDPHDPDTNAVIIGGEALRRSDAALAVLSNLPHWGWSGLLRYLPRSLRDVVYNFIARSRYRLFGRHAACDLGPKPFADRIIFDVPPRGEQKM